MQIRQKYLNASLCKFVVNSLQHPETFDVSHDFPPLTIAELSTLKQVRFFLAHPVFSMHEHVVHILFILPACHSTVD